MVPLTRQGTDVSSVFSLLGTNENGFALSRCSPLAEAVVARIAGAIGARLSLTCTRTPSVQAAVKYVGRKSCVRRIPLMVSVLAPQRISRGRLGFSRWPTRLSG
jgi:hypothetical protein